MTYETEIRQYYRKIGKCPYCHGRNKLMGDEKMCPECRAANWNYRQQYIKSHPNYLKKSAESMKMKREYRISNGLCITCGNPKNDDGFKNCEQCRLHHMLRVRKQRGYA